MSLILDTKCKYIFLFYIAQNGETDINMEGKRQEKFVKEAEQQLSGNPTLLAMITQYLSPPSKHSSNGDSLKPVAPPTRELDSLMVLCI